MHIDSEDDVNISVTSTAPLISAKVRPQSKDVSANICGNKVEISLKEYGQYVLEINGEHRVGKLELNDNDSVYIGKDAILYANIFAVGKKNIRIFGRGTINGNRNHYI